MLKFLISSVPIPYLPAKSFTLLIRFPCTSELPKIESLKIIDLAKAIAKSLGVDDIDFHKIPIKDGEKLHEDMISEIEFQRTAEFDDYYLIGYERTNERYDHPPFNSALHLTKDTTEFLKRNSVW